MCGIAGEIRFNNAAGPKADWDTISAMMARRGPDDAGIWSDDGHCTLVFRRLAIMDLSPNGHQPMTVCSGRFTLVFNGEVYNFQDLRNELETQGVQFRSTSDSEVVLYALIEWGPRALERFNGMFALAFYDRVEKRLLLARDHAGIKPLYYLIRPEGMVFASQYNQLLAHPFSRHLRISQEGLGLYLRLAYIPAPYALLENSYMLEPGTWIQFDVEGRWYEEELFHGSLDSAGEPPDSDTLLTQFHNHVIHRLKALILFQEPKAANAVTYGTAMTNRLTDSRLARQESTVQECQKVAGFMDAIVGRIRREGDHPILMVFTHGDFVPANMLTTTQGMKIIDWEGAGYRSALYDFYSYFFNRSGSRNIPVSTLIAEVQKALPLFISELAKEAHEVAVSARQGERVYRWTFYLEMLDRMIEREMSDNNLNMLSYISRYLEAFIRYEELLTGHSVVEFPPQKAGLI